MRATIRIPGGGYKSDLSREALVELVGKLEDRHRTQLYKKGDVVWCAVGRDTEFTIVSATVIACKRSSIGYPYEYEVQYSDEQLNSSPRTHLAPDKLFESEEICRYVTSQLYQKREEDRRKSPFIMKCHRAFTDGSTPVNLVTTPEEQQWYLEWFENMKHCAELSLRRTRKDCLNIVQHMNVAMSNPSNKDNYYTPQSLYYNAWCNKKSYDRDIEYWNKIAATFNLRPRENNILTDDMLKKFKDFFNIDLQLGGEVK